MANSASIGWDVTGGAQGTCADSDRTVSRLRPGNHRPHLTTAVWAERVDDGVLLLTGTFLVPVVILAIGTPIVLCVRAVIELVKWLG